MRQALVNIKSLLIKWAVICGCLILIMINLLSQGSASSNKKTYVQRAIVSNSESMKNPDTKLSVTTKHINSSLPPFKSEMDIEAEKNKTARFRAVQFNSRSNTYYSGYCTWYAKSMRPDLPNSLGNANTWLTRAQNLGLATGTEARAGAIGQQGNHVVFVEKVNSDSTITISEMNYRGFGVVSKRTVPANIFQYIY